MRSVLPKEPAKLGMHIVLPLLLLCYGVANMHCSTVHESSQDLRALLEFKQGVTSDPHGALSNWTTSSHFCRWNGVRCTSTQPLCVLGLNLTGQSLSGKIGSFLGNLTFLYYLDLTYNNFVGPLPLLGRLQQLQYLYLSNNNLSGIIPDALTNCSNLTALDLSSNLLEGPIPSKLGLLSNIKYLNLRSNQIEENIPGELGQLVKLESLLLGDNRLSGEIPDAFFHLSSLRYLSLEFNMLVGKALPPNVGELLPNLTELALENNKFQGPIPASLGNALGLQMLDLSYNNFTGPIPTALGKLLNLTFVNLEYNQLVARNDQDWEFLNALRNCTSLEILSLTGNELQGDIPQSIGNLSTTLQQLMLNANSLCGQVPQVIGKLRGLIKLGLGDNNLSGKIEGWIGNLKNLQGLSLQSNNFTGPIPSSISNLTELTYLFLSENELEGSIPASLGNLGHLQLLYLSSNNLQGNIPPSFGNLQQLVWLDLSHNNLQGDITLDFSKLKQLTDIRLSSNKLIGAISDAFGKCVELETLLMDQNYLTGNIPASFKGLQSLKTLNLSHNNLSGTIPTILEDLSLLKNLDLSYNHLQGEIPTNGAFANATAISLDGNWGFCGGARDLHMPACPVVSRVEWKHYLTILLILAFGFMSLGMSIYIIFLRKKAPRRPYLYLLSFGKKFPRVSYKDLAQATENFSEFNLVGRGSYGSVYRGKLTQAKIEVGIKVFDLETRFAEKSFISECESLRTIRHRNLLPILTACLTIDNNGNDFKALIYEFMPNGNLDTWLHQKHGGVAPKHLGLYQRLSIGVGMADALAYLHHDCGRPIVHCDLKPTNILLDDDMNAHLGDFGIASLIVDSRSIAVGHNSSGCSSSLVVRGTIGYIAPEYAQTVHASTCGDVYSFGIVLLEMITGKRPTDSIFEGGSSIINFVERKFPGQLLHIIDTHLQEEREGFIKATVVTESEVYRCVLSLVQVALSCTRPFPRERMNMREVAINLRAIRKSYVAATK